MFSHTTLFSLDAGTKVISGKTVEKMEIRFGCNISALYSPAVSSHRVCNVAFISQMHAPGRPRECLKTQRRHPCGLRQHSVAAFRAVHSHLLRSRAVLRFSSSWLCGWEVICWCKDYAPECYILWKGLLQQPRLACSSLIPTSWPCTWGSFPVVSRCRRVGCRLW